MTTTVPVLSEMPDPTNGPRTFVFVGRCRNQHERGGAAMGSQVYGVWVRGVVDYREVYSQVVFGASEYEPTTINKIGRPGAFRDMPPTDAQIDAAVAEAAAAITEVMY